MKGWGRVLEWVWVELSNQFRCQGSTWHLWRRAV